jgi:hypothetical protein
MMFDVKMPPASSASPSLSPTPSNSSGNYEPKSCLICGHVSHGYHFGILACRACAAFFRRTVAENKVYKCRGNCKCPIQKEMRNMCRCCRFRKCEELGMNKDDVQLNRDPIGKRKEIECCGTNSSQNCCPKTIVKPTPVPIEDALPQVIASSSSSSAPPLPPPQQPPQQLQQQPIIYPRFQNPQFALSQPIALVPFSHPQAPSVIQRLQEGYINFHSSQKSLFTVMYPDNIFATDVFRKATHTEFVKMERGCLSLQLSMLNDWFQPFDQLPHEIKVNILQIFSLKFSLLDSSYRTMNAFPSPTDTKWAVHYGQYLDSTDLEHFFKDDKDPTESAKLMGTVVKALIGIKNKLAKYKILETEIVALIGILLWNEVSFLLADNKTAEEVRDRIYSELHNFLILHYGLSGTGARLGGLLFILHEINVSYSIFYFELKKSF